VSYQITIEADTLTLTPVAVEITGNARAQMKWANYWDAIVKTYHVVIDGWPSKIVFAPLTQACSGVGDTQMLFKSWMDGTTHWRQLTNEEFIEEDNNREARIASGEIPGERARKTRGDKGKKQVSKSGRPITSKHARTPISKEFVDDNSDKENDGDEVENDVDLQVRTSNVNTAPVSSGAGSAPLEISLQASHYDSQPTIGHAPAQQSLMPFAAMPLASSEYPMGDTSFNGTGALSLTEELRAALGTSDDNFSQAFPANFNVPDFSAYNFNSMDLSNSSLLPPGYIPPSSF